MLASEQRSGRMPAEGQVGLICMPTSMALDSPTVQLSSQPDILPVKLCSKLPVRGSCEKRDSRSRSRLRSRQ